MDNIQNGKSDLFPYIELFQPYRTIFRIRQSEATASGAWPLLEHVHPASETNPGALPS